MNETQLLSKQTKEVLTKLYGAKNVSVRMDHGTAYGWIKANITIKKPATCTCTPFSGYCKDCRNLLRESDMQVLEATKGIHYWGWTNDMGDDRREFLCQFSFV